MLFARLPPVNEVTGNRTPKGVRGIPRTPPECGSHCAAKPEVALATLTYLRLPSVHASGVRDKMAKLHAGFSRRLQRSAACALCFQEPLHDRYVSLRIDNSGELTRVFKRVNTRSGIQRSNRIGRV